MSRDRRGMQPELDGWRAAIGPPVRGIPRATPARNTDTPNL